MTVPPRKQKARSARAAGPFKFWSGTPGSNRRPSPWQGDALPAELVPRNGSGLAPQIPCVKSVEGADVVHRGGDSGDEREVEQHQADRLEVGHRPDEEI